MRLEEGIYYFPSFLSREDGSLLFEELMEETIWIQRTRSFYGKKVLTPRKEAWFGKTSYNFGGSELFSQEMPEILVQLSSQIKDFIQQEDQTLTVEFDSCLANLYRDGRDSVGWHSDDEPEMGDPFIASVSLGAERDFLMRKKGNPSEKMTVLLEHGSLLLMGRGVQSVWEHTIPRRLKIKSSRINLTFRDCRNFNIL